MNANLPAATAIGRVVLQIADLDRSLDFYRDVVGFREVDRTEKAGRRVSHLGVADSDRVWLELREHPGAKAIPRGGLLGLYHFAVLLPSRAALGRFFAHAVNAGAQVAAANHLVSEATYLTDPDGMTIEVYRDLPRSSWRHVDGELSMATLPLDVDGVVAAASAAPPWTGLPAGTVMGHMHFYVGDLERAESFYVRGLGFQPVLRSFPGALFVSAGGYHHHVGLNTWLQRARPASDDDVRLVSWELTLPTVDDVEDVRARLDTAGYITTESAGIVEAVDPWGITVGLARP